jgi:pyrroline-5-carboxylate reductase
MSQMKIGIIGLGNMGSALLRGIINCGICSPADISASDPRLPEQANNPEYGGIRTGKDNAAAVRGSDLVILAVKPQAVKTVAASIAHEVGDQLFVSIIAGLSIAGLEEKLGSKARIIRAMPNTPVLIQQGVTALARNKKVSVQDLALIEDIFGRLGEVVEVEEKLMDAVTALSGSGPAYVYVLIEALADGGVLAGLPRNLALQLAALTVQGATAMLELGKHPGELKDMVASPAGTTIAGLAVLEAKGFRSALIEAVRAAAVRARELSDADKEEGAEGRPVL